MTKAGEREIIKAEHAYGGEGYITKEMLISDEARGEHCKMYAKVTVPVGSEIGYHIHQGGEEGYYILSGKGIYKPRRKLHRKKNVSEISSKGFLRPKTG